jgi:adenylate cyclase
MAKEIERKFLVIGDGWRGGAPGTAMRQGYISSQKEHTVRVRLAGDRAFLTLKGVSKGATRDEFEYEIPVADAAAMLSRLCQGPLVEKTRYRVPIEGLIWEVDVFEGDNEGLVVAEVELEREDQVVVVPPWAGAEVTQDARYYNANLAVRPFRTW